MIFDSPTMQRLRQKYASEPNYRVPKIILLDRLANLAEERSLLEELILCAPPKKHNDWKGRLLSPDDAQHLGAWFEMMLYDWLRQFSEVEVEPEVEEMRPDFRLLIGEQRIILEARAILIKKEQRKQDMLRSEVISLLKQLPRPYGLNIKKLTRIGPIDGTQLKKRVLDWLDNDPHLPFHFQDEKGNLLILNAFDMPTLENVGILGPTQSFWVNAEQLKSPLKEKAKKYKTLREDGNPYVLAMFLESWQLTAEEVVTAWFGQTTVVIDVDSHQVVEEKLDQSGIHYSGAEIRHTSVGGTLVFRATLDEQALRHRLRAWYIQNPYAGQAVDASSFPVESSFIVIEKNDKNYNMGWRRSV